MAKSIAIIGAGVSGLTTGVVLAENGFQVELLAHELGQQTTSAVAAAIWFPYDAEPADKVIPWALETYNVLADLTRDPHSGVSMIQLQQFSRESGIEIPAWANSLGAKRLNRSTFVMNVPLMDSSIYLDYLRDRLTNAGAKIRGGVRFEKLEDIDPSFNLVINCAGFGAKMLAYDADLEPHRGQVAIVPKIKTLKGAIVCDDAPLMYVIPRTNDCVFGGTNEISEERQPDPATTSRILAECSRTLKIDCPRLLAERVGLRPFRKAGVRLECEKLSDGRTVIHNYGHGGAGFTLSWGCARRVWELVANN